MRLLDSAFPFGQEAAPHKIRLFRDGMTFRPRFVNEWFMVLGLWEPYVLDTMHLEQGDVFIDIGAHIGYFSRRAAQRVGSSGAVIAIEADPRNIPILRLNTSTYSCVTVVPKACGVAEGTARITQKGNPLWSELEEHGTESVEVGMTTLDSCAKGLHPDMLRGRRNYFVKIDIEGGELDAIRGGSWFIERFRPDIVLEAFPENASNLSHLLRDYNVAQVAESYYYLTPKL
jgi:FkbM family methyltransferase